MRLSGIEYLDISELKHINHYAGRHYFDDDTIKFFRARIDRGAFRLPDGRLIFTESVAGGFRGTDAGRKRLYRINAMSPETGDVSRIAEYSTGKARDKALLTFLADMGKGE
jgi:hypothetical protein